MDASRQNPEALLRAIHQEESSSQGGHLKIFFGYAAGVGKTYAMLEAAHQARARGIDVLVGYVEPHARPATSALLSGLPSIPIKRAMQSGIEVNEFDLDAVLLRKPQLVLVDELAHTNAEGCRHQKRYQDIQELLKAGIDVYTTVNVQHIESLNDQVAAITGVLVRERIPDFVFDHAHQVELVDIEPEELLQRLKAGNIYREQQAARAVQNFFSVENLTALREIALRRCADRVNLITEAARIRRKGDYHTDEHILVCLSSAPSNAKIVRTAARMASAFRGNFTALFVETPSYNTMEEEDKKRLREHIHLAEQLGARIETIYGDDVPYQIAEFARLSGVSKIVIGRSSAIGGRKLFGSPTLTERLTRIAPNLDIHIIPDSGFNGYYRAKKAKPAALSPESILKESLKTLAVLVAATLICFLFTHFGWKEANLVTVYILAVLITAVITTNRIYSLAASLMSVLVFNFFFTIPRFTFQAYDPGYTVTFAVMFCSALMASSLTVKLKNQARQSAQAAFRTKILLETNQRLEQAPTDEEIFDITGNQLLKLLDRDIIMYPIAGKDLGSPRTYPLTGSDSSILTSDNERAVAAWVMKNNKHAGATTGTLGSARCLYLSIRVNESVYGVVGIHMRQSPLDSFENSILLSILGECALAMENSHNAREKEAAAVMAKNEQLRANLLRAISHDLRTPLTSISGNANNLLFHETDFDPETKKQIYTDIYDDSMWLINLVENLLSVTRIEEGRMNMHISAELMDEVIAEAMKHISRKASEHTIEITSTDEFLMARMDAKLMVQVIINIVDNAIKYTPPGSKIHIHTTKKDDSFLSVSISDDGPGIPDEHKTKVFDMFYSGANKVADSRRSFGLGLSLCKSIITAHGGEIHVQDNVPSGSIFTFTLPIGEIDIRPLVMNQEV